MAHSGKKKSGIKGVQGVVKFSRGILPAQIPLRMLTIEAMQYSNLTTDFVVALE